MRIYTISTESFKYFVNNIELELNKIKDVNFFCKYIDDLPENYRKTSFKLKYIHENIILEPKNYGSQVIFVDCTVLFDHSMYNLFLESINKDLDIMIAKEYKSSTRVNIGVMAIKCNEKVADFFKQMICTIDQYGSWDQTIFHQFLHNEKHSKNLNWDFFDRETVRIVSSQNDKHILDELIQEKPFIYKFIRRPKTFESDVTYAAILNNILKA